MTQPDKYVYGVLTLHKHQENNLIPLKSQGGDRAEILSAG